MVQGVEVERLLDELKRASSPFQRIRVLRRAWETLRGLGPAQLRDLATRAGLERAERVLERLARRKGRLTPSMMLQLLQSSKEMTPEQVEVAAKALRDPRQRKEWLFGRAATIESMLQSEPAMPVAARAGKGVSEGEDPNATCPPGHPDPAAAAASEIEDGDDRGEPTPTPSSIPESTRVQMPEVLASMDQSEDAGIHRTPAVAERPPPHEPLDGTQQVAELVESLKAAPTSMLRLKLLRQQLDAIRTLSIDDLQRLVESFPDGWPRRRAVDALLLQRVPETSDEAMRLIERLSSATARRWCVGTLLDSWTLDPRTRCDLIRQHRLTPYRRSAGSSERADPPGSAGGARSSV